MGKCAAALQLLCCREAECKTEMPSRRVQLMVGLVRGSFAGVGSNCAW
jgi:hypothetical protein